MRRQALFATSFLFLSSPSWSGAYQAETREKLCREDQIASFDPLDDERSEKPTRERVFASPLHGVPNKSIIEAATDLLDYPMVWQFIIEVNGTPYGFRLEPHYHPPGFEDGPIGWHKGVTVYEIEERDAAPDLSAE